ncbi:hypothetical protein DFH09DRAFT_1306040 [Mycena vulgaris]|nr:hypothetical protein DFH09DRAFT_1319420 [Mycena vulgaris]KAJ6592127.1 hypothetical protein DFH09DRAFT_1306040 [Mycena vulgaris]
MPAHDPTAVAAARDSLRESIDAFRSITPTATNLNFRVRVINSVLDAGALFYGFKEVLNSDVETKEMVYTCRDLVNLFAIDNPGWKPAQQALRDINAAIDSYQVERAKRKEARRVSRVKAAEKAAAKAEAKKVGKSPIVVPDSEDDRSDGEKRLNWVVKKFIDLQMDVDTEAELFGPAPTTKSVPTGLHFNKVRAGDVPEDKAAPKFLFTKANLKSKDKLLPKRAETVRMPYEHHRFLNRHSVAYKKARKVLSKTSFPEHPRKRTRAGSHYGYDSDGDQDNAAPSLLTEEIMHDNLARAANLLATQDFEDPVAFYDRREAQLKTEIVKLGGRIDFFLRLHDHAVADLTNVRADRAKEFPAGSSEDTSMPAASGSKSPVV